MNEIIETLHLPVGNEAVRRFLIKQGYTYKKSLCIQKNRSVPDVQIKRKTWIENIAGAKPEHQIYLDESGINTNLTRHYAHAVHGKRAIDAMRSHHAKIVTELLDKSGISYLYLPPYSPDLNPIEKMWSKMKSILVSPAI